MASWDVVVFLKDNSCEYVPSSWAVNSSKNLYLWPKKLTGNQILKLRDNCEAPRPNIEYDEWSGTCKGTVYTIEEAQKQVEKALYTSNLSSDEDAVGEFTDESIVRSRYLRKRSAREIGEPSFGSTPKRRYLDKEADPSPGVASVSSNIQINSPSLNNTGPMELLLQEMKKLNKSMMSMRYDISDMKKDINDVKISLNAFAEQSHKAQSLNLSKFKLPVCSLEELEELENKIKQCSENFQDLVRIFCRVGGITPKKSVLLIMKKFMNRELSLQYSARGRKQKRNFSELTSYQAILEAVKSNFPLAVDLEITQWIGQCLATAGDREGGRQSRPGSSQISE